VSDACSILVLCFWAHKSCDDLSFCLFCHLTQCIFLVHSVPNPCGSQYDTKSQVCLCLVRWQFDIPTACMTLGILLCLWSNTELVMFWCCTPMFHLTVTADQIAYLSLHKRGRCCKASTPCSLRIVDHQSAPSRARVNATSS